MRTCRVCCLAASLCAVWFVSGCVPKPKPATSPTLMPALAPAYPEFHYPDVPASLRDPRATAALDRGWQSLQRNDIAAAQREFQAALGSEQTFYPAIAAQGYAALGRQQYADALQSFDAALTRDRTYLPALVGRGHALLALDRPDEALVAFDAAATQDPTLEELRNRVDVLRFRSVQTRIAQARAAAAAGRISDARAAYDAAIAASPESGFLFRELAAVDRAAADDSASIAHLRRAIELDSTDASAFVELGAALERQSDLPGALRAYSTAATLDPGTEIADRIAAVNRRLREAQLPAPYAAIAAAAQITRGDLAALIGIRLESLVASAPKRPVVVTDTRGHWAASWIAQVVDAGLIPAFDNHTFQPSSAVRRVDLADVAARALRLLPPSPRLAAARATARLAIADVQPSHLSYRAIVDVVNAGIMPLVDGRFLLTRAVSGAEAIDVVNRLQALVAAAP
jgi:tetratricopeptide (TPR) repeat protein